MPTTVSANLSSALTAAEWIARIKIWSEPTHRAIKPQIEKLANDEFPKLVTAYIDCQEAAGAVCAARGIFSLPVVQLWFGGQRFAEFARVLSMGEMRSALERPYGLLM